jgi:integrase
VDKAIQLFHGKRHPRNLGGDHVTAFLSDLAVRGRVFASTQNQALHAVLFMYREVLKIELPWLEGMQHAKRPERLPVVFTRQEVKQLLAQLDGTPWLMTSLTYGGGLRLLECLRLRVKDVDFGHLQVLVRDGKGFGLTNQSNCGTLPAFAYDPACSPSMNSLITR